MNAHKKLFALYLIFLVLRPFDLFLPEVNEYRPMLVVGSVAIAAGIHSAFVKRKFSIFGDAFITIMALVAAASISVAANGWLGGGIRALTDLSSTVALVILSCICIDSSKDLHNYCKAYAYAVFIVVLVALLSYHTGWHAHALVMRQTIENDSLFLSAENSHFDFQIAPWEDESNRYLYRIRWLGFLADPNDLGQAIAIAIPLLWIDLKNKELIFKTAPRIICTGILLYGIYLTKSRGALLAVVGTVLAFSYMRLGAKLSAISALGFLAFFAIFGLTAGGREISLSDQSSSERVDAWADGLAMLYSHPLLGVGYGNFIEHHPRVAHNSYVECFAETGVVGYFLWIALIVQSFNSLRIDRGSSLNSAGCVHEKIILFCSLAGYLLAAFFLSRAFQPLLYFVLGLSLSISGIIIGGNANPTHFETFEKRRGRDFIIVSGVISILSIFGIKVLVMYRSFLA